MVCDVPGHGERMYMDMSFGRAIREARRQRGISQKELADRAGIDFTYLSKIENDRMPPPSEKAITAMSEALEMDADELIRLAGKVPTDLAEFLVTDPEAIKFLRSLQGDVETRQDWTDLLKRKGKM
jgi:HTH-type transcriptional regulator, competence development regulator